MKINRSLWICKVALRSFDLTKHPPAAIVSDMRCLARDVQRFYPWIYLACHVDHIRARSTDHRLSTRDASLLAHLDPSVPGRYRAREESR